MQIASRFVREERMAQEAVDKEIKDLWPLIEESSIECLNQDATHTISHCFKQVRLQPCALCALRCVVEPILVGFFALLFHLNTFVIGSLLSVAYCKVETCVLLTTARGAVARS